MGNEVDLGAICQDDRCGIVEIHETHEVTGNQVCRLALKAHHRPRTAAPWKSSDRSGIMGSIMKSSSGRVPKWFQEIASDVRNDYGEVTDRTIWRWIKILVDRGQLMKLDVGLAFAVYMRPRGKKRASGRIEDPAELRDHMLSIVEIHPTTNKT